MRRGKWVPLSGLARMHLEFELSSESPCVLYGEREALHTWCMVSAPKRSSIRMLVFPHSPLFRHLCIPHVDVQAACNASAHEP